MKNKMNKSYSIFSYFLCYHKKLRSCDSKVNDVISDQFSVKMFKFAQQFDNQNKIHVKF